MVKIKCKLRSVFKKVKPNTKGLKFVLKHKSSREYLVRDTYCHGVITSSDINKARIFSRKSDATQSNNQRNEAFFPVPIEIKEVSNVATSQIS